MTAVAGLTVWGVLLLGVAAVSDGTLTRVPLAVLALTALAAFEAVTAMPAAALQLSAARASADRIGAILDAPDPVADPAASLPAAVRPGPGAAARGAGQVRARRPAGARRARP